MKRLLTATCAVVLIAAANAHAQTGAPEPYQFDGRYLSAVRERISKGDERLNVSLGALDKEAAKALAVAPMSVMDKGIVPPSGDKHDYMSQAPYWWPDPSKPDGLPYIRHDGKTNPEINKLSDRTNLGRLGGTIATLGLAHYFAPVRPASGTTSSVDQYANHAARLARVWFLDPATRMNPHLKFGQGIPGITLGRGIGIIETRNLVDVLDGIQLIRGSSAWTAPDEAGLQAWMRAFLTWLMESPEGKEESKNGNNHETWYDVQIVSMALYTGQTDLARRILEGSRNRIATQIEPDGRQPRETDRTRGYDYSLFNLEAFFRLASLGDRLGVDLWNYRSADGRSLRQALDYLIPYATGEKKWTGEQITEWRPQAIHPLLRRAAVGWKEPRYRELATKIGGGSARMDLTLP
jgi:hypothetical protein